MSIFPDPTLVQECSTALGRAEKAGFKVNPPLKNDIEARKTQR
jgi:hypothetical protein